MKRRILKAALTMALMVVPAIAEAAGGYSTANVNMRSGPSTQYPAVVVIPAGQPVEIHGCLADLPWCDISFYGGRGWVAGRYVQATYQQRRVYVDPQYYRPLGIPTVRFNVGNYWDRYYRDRDFYGQRDRWDRGPDWHRRPDRRDPDWDRDRNRDNADRGPDRRPDRRNDPQNSNQGGPPEIMPPRAHFGGDACPPGRPNCSWNNN